MSKRVTSSLRRTGRTTWLPVAPKPLFNSSIQKVVGRHYVTYFCYLEGIHV